MRTIQAALVATAAMGLWRPSPASDDSNTVRKVGFIDFVADESIQQDRLAKLADHMDAVQRQLSDELGIAPLSKTIRVLIYPSRRAYYLGVRRFILGLSWADTAGRHGLFLLRDEVPYLFLLESDELASSLRHETVHAVLNLRCKGLPIWLDEGLAQCYAQTDGSHFSERANSVLKRSWMHGPPMTEDELARISEMRQMTSRAYAEAWRIVYRWLDTRESREGLSRELQLRAK